MPYKVFQEKTIRHGSKKLASNNERIYYKFGIPEIKALVQSRSRVYQLRRHTVPSCILARMHSLLTTNYNNCIKKPLKLLVHSHTLET